MSTDGKDREDMPPGGISDDLHAIDRAMLLAISHRQRDSTPLSLDQERLLDSWIAGRLPSHDADRAAELTKHNKLAAERILERRLIAAADQGAGIPSALEARILKVSRPPRTGAGGAFGLRWPTFSAWQWSGLSAAAAAVAVIAVLGFQVWQAQLRSDQSFQIAMVTFEDRSVLFEASRYRTRGGQQQAPTPGTSASDNLTESRFRDLEIPTALLRRAINSASTDKRNAVHSELMTYLRAQNEAFDVRSRIVIDSLLADSANDKANDTPSTQIRVYDLDDPRAAPIRGKIQTLQSNARAILLTLRR